MPKSVHDFWSYGALRGEQDLENREERTLAQCKVDLEASWGWAAGAERWIKDRDQFFFYSEKYQVKESWVSPPDDGDDKLTRVFLKVESGRSM